MKLESQKKDVANKMGGHTHFYRHLSVGDKQKKCIHCSMPEQKGKQSLNPVQRGKSNMVAEGKNEWPNQ